MHCPSCGSMMRHGQTVCARCGTPVDPSVASFGGAAHALLEAWGLPAQPPAEEPARQRISRGLVAAIVALSIVAACLTGAIVAQHLSSTLRQGVIINQAQFPDPVIRAIVLGFDADGNGALSQEEIDSVTRVDCTKMGVKNLEGLRLFTNLSELVARDNALTSADLSGLGNLVRVDLANNAIGELDVSGMASLVELDVSNNAMSALDVSGCTSLARLYCAGNDIARLDLTDAVSLGELVRDEGQNTVVPISEYFFPSAAVRNAVSAFDTDGSGSLSLRERQAVTSIKIADPSVTDLGGLTLFPNLTDLDVSGTQIDSLEGRALPSGLLNLRARGCAIRSVDLSRLAHLTTLDLSHNPLSTLDGTALVRLTSLDVSECGLTGTLDLSACGRLTHVDAHGNAMLSVLVVPSLESLSASSAVLVDTTCAIVRQAYTPVVAAPSPDPASAEPSPSGQDGSGASSAAQ